MRVPVSWLRDFAPFGPAEDLVAVADDLGLVVEGIEQVGEGLEQVVVARVVEITAIQGADRIRRVVVDAGGDDLEIVCGAWNFSEGDLVPLAPVGTVLPGGMEIGRRKMRGVTSEGMLCSGRELALSDDGAGLMVLSGAAADAAPGTPIAQALGIERDTVLDIAVEANRPDAMCMAGIARDLAARLGLTFTLPDPPQPPTQPGDSAGTDVASLASVQVPDPDLCPRFTARVLTGITIGPSPSIVARRLVLCGMRPLNNVVDASNYVMLELGQPTHPYDFDRVAGHTLRARAGRPGEAVVTLDGNERRVAERSVGPGDNLRDCLICDGDDAPIGIGGVMGGSSTEVTDATTRVLLEGAYFTPMAIARTAMRLGLRTEASVRFERGCDPFGIDRAMLRLCEVLGQSAGPEFAVVSGSLDVRGDIADRVRVGVRTARLNAVLGATLDDSQIVGYLDPIGFEAKVSEPGVLEVTVPSFRPDSTREIDVIEEVARHHGYGALPRRTPRPSQVGLLTERQSARRKLRNVLSHTGAHEAWTPSLITSGDHERVGLTGADITVANPLNPDESVLRRTLLPGMLRSLALNLNRRQAGVRFFEIGNVFPLPDPARIDAAMRHQDPAQTVADERELAGLLLGGPGDDATTAVLAWRAISDVMGIESVDVVQLPEGEVGATGLHPTRAARLIVTTGADAGSVIGELGEIDPEVLSSFGVDSSRGRVGWLVIDFSRLLGVAPRRSVDVTPVSRYPSADIDLAFVVPDGVPAGDVERTLTTSGGPLLERLWLFDVFRGAGIPPGERSLAYRLRFCASDRTLTDEDVARLRDECITSVEREHRARIRG